VAIAAGTQDTLFLGNLEAKRDWGHARDYVDGMWRVLQQDRPDDFVLATGEAHSVREFVDFAFREVGIEITWQGTGLDEVGLDNDGTQRVRIDQRYFRPTEVDYLLGDASKAQRVLGWRPQISFQELVREMVASDRDALANGKPGGSRASSH